MLLEAGAIVLARVRAALIGVVQQAGVRTAPLHRLVERAQREVAVVDRTERPAHDEPGVEVQDGRQIQLGAAADDELRRVADPALIGPLGRELAVEHIGGDRLIVIAHRRRAEPLPHAGPQALVPASAARPASG